MDNKIIVISGMSGSGKDEVTSLLCELSDKFVSLKKYRSIGPNYIHKEKYFNVTNDVFKAKIVDGDFLQYHYRYERYYGIAQDTLKAYLDEGKIPIVHIGRIDNYNQLKRNLEKYQENLSPGVSLNVIHIQLWNFYPQLIDIIRDRQYSDEDFAERIYAIEQEFGDNVKLAEYSDNPYDLVIRNNDSKEAAQKIMQFLESGPDDSTLKSYEEFKEYLKENKGCFPKQSNSSEWKYCEINTSLNGLDFKTPIIIDNVRLLQGNRLEISNCCFNKFVVKNQFSDNNKGSLHEIVFKSCVIGTIEIYKCNNIKFVFDNCDGISHGKIDSIEVDQSLVSFMKIEKSNVQTLSYSKSKVENMWVVNNSSVDKTDCKDSNVSNLNVTTSSRIDYLRTNGTIDNLELKEGAYLKRFSIDGYNELLTFLKKMRSERTKPAVAETKPAQQHKIWKQKMILLALLSDYEKDHRFSEADKCLIELRSTENMDKRIDGHKFIAGLSYVFLELMCGWGVKVYNILYSTIAVIILFALLMFYSLFKTLNGVDFCDFLNCLWISFCSFFNLDSNLNINSCMDTLITIEEACGIIILTVFTGMIVRKIIR